MRRSGVDTLDCKRRAHHQMHQHVYHLQSFLFVYVRLSVCRSVYMHLGCHRVKEVHWCIRLRMTLRALMIFYISDTLLWACICVCLRIVGIPLCLTLFLFLFLLSGLYLRSSFCCFWFLLLRSTDPVYMSTRIITNFYTRYALCCRIITVLREVTAALKE